MILKLTDPTTFEGAIAVGVVAGLILAAVLGAVSLVRRRKSQVDVPAEPIRRPDVRILEMDATGGSAGRVDLSVHVANYGELRCRGMFTASIDGREVTCNPPMRDLVPGDPEQRIEIIVPSPELGDLVPALNNETTLYSRTLVFKASDGENVASQEWREHIYDSQTELARHEAQQRAWRIGRGKDTADDRRAEFIWESERRREDELC